MPSWRPGAARDTVVAFLDAAESLPSTQRVAAFDNDGTLWCERPTPVQFDFFVDALAAAAADDASLRDRPEYAAVLATRHGRDRRDGLERVALALAELFAGIEPRRVRLAGRARSWSAPATAPSGSRCVHAVYQPMLELLEELRRRKFTICIVSGGGTEFVRAISVDLYGVPPEAVVGTLIAYEFDRDDDGRPMLRSDATTGERRERRRSEGGRTSSRQLGSPPDPGRRQLRR